MLILQDKNKYVGKTIASIETDGGTDAMHMTHRIRFNFTDGTSLKLAIDWRGGEAYISEYDTKPD